jgi:D-alanyl-D-alanine carboxypeptidase (penicillin-binding protein 5/6)
MVINSVIKFGWINLLFSFFLAAEPLKFDIRGEAAILINAQSGAILFEDDAYTPHYPASTTKVAAALYALKLKGNALEMFITAEQDSLATITPEEKRKSNYKLPPYWLETDGVHIGIKKGEIFTLHDLLKGMLISSGNDAANVVAQALGPSVPRFMENLNAYLKEIGCKNTNFCNPHGLHHPQHTSTAFDLALITSEALKNSIFCDIVSQPRFMRPKTNKQAATTLLQGNRLIRSGKYFYARAIGVKTGYHSKAKNTFIGAARADGRTLIAVLLGYQDRKNMFEDSIKLFEAAFNQPKVQRLFLKSGPQAFTIELPKGKQPLKTYLPEPLSLDFYPAEDPQAKCLLYWRPLLLPIEKDQQVGELHLISAQGIILKKAPLLALEEVKLSWPYRWILPFSSYRWLFIFGVGLIGIAFLSTIWKIVRPK